MDDATDPATAGLDALDTVLAETGRVVAGVGTDQWHLPTPCAEWDVAAVVEHLAGGHRRVAEQLGSAVPAAATDLAEGYAAASAAVAAAVRTPGVLERVYDLPAGQVPGSVMLGLRVTDTLVHGWDVARATGRPYDVPDPVCAWVLAFSERMLESVPRGGRFADRVDVAADRSPLDRVVACLGRDPRWRPA